MQSGSTSRCKSSSISDRKSIIQEEQLLERITGDPKIMMGKPVIRGTRLAVEYILNLRAYGASEEEILTEYQGIKREDIQA